MELLSVLATAAERRINKWGALCFVQLPLLF